MTITAAATAANRRRDEERRCGPFVIVVLVVVVVSNSSTSVVAGRSGVAVVSGSARTQRSSAVRTDRSRASNPGSGSTRSGSQAQQIVDRALSHRWPPRTQIGTCDAPMREQGLGRTAAAADRAGHVGHGQAVQMVEHEHAALDLRQAAEGALCRGLEVRVIGALDEDPLPVVRRRTPPGESRLAFASAAALEGGASQPAAARW